LSAALAAATSFAVPAPAQALAGPPDAPARLTVDPAGTAADSDGDGLTDGFEQLYGLDPVAADSDGDGLLDPAVDLDNDGLSNLAEQSFGTNPLRRDTDHDGTIDGLGDANGDGIVDWTQQDRRPVPSRLTPSLANANSDYICYRPGVGSTGKCVGDATGTTRIVIYGDSHAGQCIPALDRYAKEHHWRLGSLAKSGCPSVHVDVSSDATYNAACRKWRKTSEQNLRASPPDLVIITNYSHYGPTPDRWRDGLKAVIAAVAPTEVMVLADTPLFPHRVPKCLDNHPNNMGACEVPRSIGIRAKHDSLEAAVAKASGHATFASMNPWVCPYMLCPVIVSHLLLWRDDHHITVTYSRQMAEALGALLPARIPR